MLMTSGAVKDTKRKETTKKGKSEENASLKTFSNQIAQNGSLIKMMPYMMGFLYYSLLISLIIISLLPRPTHSNLAV